ncbi:MAG: anti-sigma factor family protein [Methyloligella sp. ZOD6]
MKNTDNNEVREIDLLAYADGLLENDPLRRAEIERHLAERPRDEALVAEIRAQNDAIRALYGREIARPIPERHLRVLQRRKTDWPRRLGTAVAACMAMIIAGIAGHLIGQAGEDAGSVPTEFIRNAGLFHDAATRAPSIGNEVDVLPVDASRMEPQKTLHFAIDVPDLSQQGYRLVGKSNPDSADPSLVRLTYRDDAQAETVHVFLRARGRLEAGEMHASTDHDVTKRYWTAGPLVVAVTADAGNKDAEILSEAVRRSFERIELFQGHPTLAAAAKGNGGIDEETSVQPPSPTDLPLRQVN